MSLFAILLGNWNSHYLGGLLNVKIAKIPLKGYNSKQGTQIAARYPKEVFWAPCNHYMYLLFNWVLLRAPLSSSKGIPKVSLKGLRRTFFGQTLLMLPPFFWSKNGDSDRPWPWQEAFWVPCNYSGYLDLNLVLLLPLRYPCFLGYL